MPRRVKSTLKEHCFPAFYACYLLKSIRTPRATATYIGSTPSPPRRIRQHNGEISQGAWKTKHNRPWVMQMIVHGFPSKLAALQFEWAWQHPHISRHLRDDDGKAVFHRSNSHLKSNVRAAINMVSSHPYNTWPLHVKLFTEEAVKAWTAAGKESSTPQLPPGFTCTVELEGVDGLSGNPGTGRRNAINVTDDVFTTAHLKKASSVASMKCSVCRKPISQSEYKEHTLTIALCPTTTCTSVAHLDCLASHFLAAPGPSSTDASKSELIPRGGCCPSCHTYILWGDVIRGCYRRHQGDAIALDDVEDEDADDDADKVSNTQQDVSNQKSKRGRSKKLHALAEEEEESEGELFDLDDIPGSSDGDHHPVRRTGLRTQTAKSTITKRKSKAKSTSTRITPAPSSVPGPSMLPTSKTIPVSPKTSKKFSKGSGRTFTSKAHGQSHSGEFFDLNAISSDDESDHAPVAPRISQFHTTPQPVRPTATHSENPVTRPKPQIKFKVALAPGEVDFFDFLQNENIPSSSDEGQEALEILRQGRLVREEEEDSEVVYAMSTLSVSSPCPSDEDAHIPVESNEIIILSDSD
ncbi:hypothetical protein C8Q75DRAFT_255636 [Abortiporus biennis]|nr:hypothetical protein C8Q75DRAFT_255636 [Abortiporus biennis]